MDNKIKNSLVTTFLSVGLFACANGEKYESDPQTTSRMSAVEELVETWPEASRKAAEATIDTYGVPDEATPSLLIWYNNGPWKRTAVHKEAVQHNFPLPHKDVLEQTINMSVPENYFDDLAFYDGSVIVDRTKGEVSARCDSEAANFLALNIAHDVVAGKRSVLEARDAYADHIRVMLQGDPQPYVKGFQFDVTSTNVTNPDEAVLDKSDLVSGR